MDENLDRTARQSLTGSKLSSANALTGARKPGSSACSEQVVVPRALTAGSTVGSARAPARSSVSARRAGARDEEGRMIRKLKSGEYRLYSRKEDPRTGRRRNLGTFKTRAAAEQHERAVQYFKRRG
jgi:hypothetical protein